MAFISDIRGATVIDDRNWRDFVKPPSADGASESGFIPRDEDRFPLGCYKGTTTVPADMLMDEKQLLEVFEKQEREGTSLKQLIDAFNFRGWLNQNPTNYCWCYAVIHAVMIARMLAGLPIVRLSPYSVAAMIKKGGNYGGWGSQALEYIVEHGIASTAVWPCEDPSMSSSQQSAANMAAIRNWRQYDDESRADAATRKVQEWYDVRPRNFLEKMSLVAHRIPVPSGYNWMGHEMCTIRGVILPNGRLGCEDMDHYGSGGQYNSRVMTASKGTADDAVAPVVSAANYAV